MLMANAHHSFCDGLTWSQLFYSMSDGIGNEEYEKQNYPFIRMRSVSTSAWIAAFFLALPHLGSLTLDVIKAQYYRFASEKTKLNFHEPETNPIKRYGMTGFMIGQYNTSLSKQISIQKVKDFAKKRGMTINDVMHAIVSVSLKKFF